jgi:1,4-dihydroxy-2-naphthoyl-CoA synthase
MKFKEIIYEKDAGTARVTINRPERYNAFKALTLEEMYYRTDESHEGVQAFVEKRPAQFSKFRK